MFRQDNPINPPIRTINCVLMNGGVGDHMGSLVAIDYIVKTYPWIKVLLWCPDFLADFAKNVLTQDVKVYGFSEMTTKGYDPNRTTIHSKWDGRSSPMKIHSVDYAFHVLCDEEPSIDKKNYLKVNFTDIDISRFNLPKKYVVVTTGYTAKVREFHPDSVNGVIDYVLSKGYTPVFLGQTNTATGAKHVIEGTFKEEIRYDKGINLIDNTSLLEAAAIMQASSAVVGVDNGLLHIAGCTDAKIVGGYTTVSPNLRNPTRNNVLGYDCFNVVPDKSLGCRFCQVKTNFLYGHDYKNCLYDDYKCVTELTAAKFIEQLAKILI